MLHFVAFIQTLGTPIPSKKMEDLNMELQAWHSRGQRNEGTSVLGVHRGNMGVKEEPRSGVVTHPQF